jgi:YidC/Oxa1 family membrane protein insertase
MDRKTIIAFAVIILVFLLLPYYYKMISPPSQPVSKPDTTAQIAPDTARSRDSVMAAIPAPSVMTPDTSLTVVGDFPVEENPAIIIVETPLYRMELSTRGAVLGGCRLKKYQGQSHGQVELIRAESRDILNLVLYRKGNPLTLQNVKFAADKQELVIPAGGKDEITFTAAQGGSTITKTYTFSGDAYTVNLGVQAAGIADLDPYYELHWGSGLAITEADTGQDIYYAQAYAFMGGQLEKFDGKGDKDQQGSAEGETKWAAQRNKYFEVALLPVSQPARGVIFNIKAQPLYGKHRPKVFGMALRMNGSLNQSRDEFTLFCGPMDQKLLTSVDPALEATMNWGWKIIEPFSKLVLWTLKALHTFIANYGLVLIVFSIIIKIVVWPLTHKSTKAMSRMAMVQPKMKELQEKYKGQPEKLNKATMQLYKEEGVNPLSGCWPTLLQMPLLYALFIVFRSTIELRGQPFVFWITDLSMPDYVAALPFSIPFFGNQLAILPLVMGVTQFMMSKMMITDPKQKFNVYFMPIFMVLIFNSFPSGLTLYYTLFNLWTYLQQKYIQKKGLIPAPVTSKG